MTTKKQTAFYTTSRTVHRRRGNRTILWASSALIVMGTGPLTWQYLREKDSDRQVRRSLTQIGIPSVLPPLSGTQAPTAATPRFHVADVTQALSKVIPLQINNRGEVLGLLARPLPEVAPARPAPPGETPKPRRPLQRYDLVLNQNGVCHNIGLLPPAINFHCASLNDQGQVACVLVDGSPLGKQTEKPHGRVYLWQNGKRDDLGILDQVNDNKDTVATLLQSDLFLNNAGCVAVSLRDGLFWNCKQWTTLETSMLWGLGAGGQIVGRPTASPKSMDASEGVANLVFFDTNTKARSAYSIGQEMVIDVNEARSLITLRTYASMMEGRNQFSMWRDNRLVPIATVSASSASRAFLNDKGQVAGIARGIMYSAEQPQRRIPGRGPLLWENDNLYQLDDLLTDADQRTWELTQVMALNNKGDILCYANRKGDSERHTLLLTRIGTETRTSPKAAAKVAP